MKIGDNGLNVERHRAVRNGHVIAVVSEEKPVRNAAGTWQPVLPGLRARIPPIRRSAAK